jgi:hypothetical protein
VTSVIRMQKGLTQSISQRIESKNRETTRGETDGRGAAAQRGPVVRGAAVRCSERTTGSVSGEVRSVSAGPSSVSRVMNHDEKIFLTPGVSCVWRALGK